MGRQLRAFLRTPVSPAFVPSHGPMGPMLRWERRATGNLGYLGPSYPASGFRWLRPHIVLSWDQGLARDIRDLSHQEAGLPGPCCGHKVTSKEDPFQPTCPLAYQTLGRLPIPALSVLYSSPGNHCELPPALSQSVLSPTDLHPATTTTFNPQPPPGTSQESFLSCLQSRQDPPLTWNSLYLLRTPVYLPVDGPRQRGDSQLSRDSSRTRTGHLDTKGEMSYSHLSHLDAYSS